MCTRSWYQRSSISFTCATWLIHIPFLCEHTPTHTLCTSRCIHNSHVHRLLISKIKSSNLKRHVCAMGHIRAIGHSQKLSCICTLTYAHRLLMSKMKSPLHTPTYTLSTSICIYISYVHRLLISKIGSSCTHMWACAHMFMCVCVYMDSDIEDQILLCPYVHTHVYTYVHTLLISKMQFSNSKRSATHSYIFVYICTEQINEWARLLQIYTYSKMNRYVWMSRARSYTHSYIYFYYTRSHTLYAHMYVSYVHRLPISKMKSPKSSRSTIIFHMCDMTHSYICIYYARSHTLYAPQIQRRARSIWFDVIW